MNKSELLDSRDAFTRGYFKAALWLSTDDNGGGLEYLNYSEDDLTALAIKCMIHECEDFQQENASALAETYECPRYDEARAGFDFWLTRNQHGAGFWDRGLGAVGHRLTNAAHTYGSSDLYVVRGKIHVS